MKIFKKKDMDLQSLNEAYFEDTISKMLSHVNILDSKGYYEDSNYLIIIFELMSTDLRELFMELKEPMPEI